MNVGSLFSGVGLLDYGLHLAGFRHAWLCEKVPERREILALRFPGVPIYEDVADVDERAARVDVVAGGFPCKGVSSAGRREGFGHPETALWREMLRVVRVLRPRYVLVENVADLLALHDGRLFGEVLGGLAESGYDAEWDCFPAAAFGAPHRRDRVFLTAIANTDGGRRRARPRESVAAGQSAAGGDRSDSAANASSTGLEGRGVRGATADRAPEALADSERLRRRSRSGLRPGDEGRKRRRRPVDRNGEAAADPDGRGLKGKPPPGGADGGVVIQHGDDADGRGVAVEWGRYEAAIRRWEVLLGRAAPEPLIRRVDDGRSVAVERSRLSALGDGVLVQAGWLVGKRLMQYERERRAA